MKKSDRLVKNFTIVPLSYCSVERLTDKLLSWIFITVGLFRIHLLPRDDISSL